MPDPQARSLPLGRILVIEDIASLAMTYAGQLETAGYSVDNVIRRAVVMSQGPELLLASFASGGGKRAPAPAAAVAPAPPVATGLAEPDAAMLAGMTLDAIERWAIESSIRRHHGSLRKAASALGLSPSTLYRKRERWLGVA